MNQERPLVFEAQKEFVQYSQKQDQINKNYNYSLSQSSQFQQNYFYSHLIFDQEKFNEFYYRLHLLLVYQGLMYSLKNLQGPSENYLKQKTVCLPQIPNENIKKTLFFDLDETLIHYCDANERADCYFTLKGESNQEYMLGINIRPYTKEILKLLANYYEIYIFTASSEAYANKIVQILDPEAKTISGCLSRDNCKQTKNGLYIKDLRIIENRTLNNIFIVDNNVHSFAFQIENGIPILPWNQNNYDDRELYFLAQYLIKAVNADDVRLFNREKLGLIKLANFMQNENLFN